MSAAKAKPQTPAQRKAVPPAKTMHQTPDPRSLNPSEVVRPPEEESPKRIRDFEIHGIDFVRGLNVVVTFDDAKITAVNARNISSSLCLCDVRIEWDATAGLHTVKMKQGNSAAVPVDQQLDLR